MEKLNLKPGKDIGKIKKEIERAILDGEIGNNYEESFLYMMKIKDKIL